MFQGVEGMRSQIEQRVRNAVKWLADSRSTPGSPLIWSLSR